MADVIRELERQGILAGYDLSKRYPELGETILVCATETRTKEDMEQYRFHLERVISELRPGSPRAAKVADTKSS